MDAGVGLADDADRADEHALGRRRPRGARGGGGRRRQEHVEPARRRRDVGRRAERRQRLSRAARARQSGARLGCGRPGGRGERRRWHGDDLPRIQGRHRHCLADRRTRTPSACSSRRTTGPGRGSRSAACRSDASSDADRVSLPPRPALGEGVGSIVVVVATDAPLLPHQCERLALRAMLGVARVGRRWRDIERRLRRWPSRRGQRTGWSRCRTRR